MTTGVVFTLAMIATAGCGSSHPPGRPNDGPMSSPRPAASPSDFATVIQNGAPNPEDAIPNPGTGKGNPALLAALLPRTAAGRPAAAAVSPAVVALPDTNLKSLFVGLRQVGAPVTGPPECRPWTAGLPSTVLARFNQPGVQLAVSSQAVSSGPDPTGFAESVITGPPAVLAAVVGPVPPASCRAITAQTSQPGGVRPLAIAAHGLRARAYEVTGSGKTPVWIWGEVVRGPGFLVEIRIPVQSAVPAAAMPARLPAITARAYQRVLAALDGR